MTNSKFITIAKITSVHGLKGEVKIFLYGNKEDFLSYKEFYLDKKRINFTSKNKNKQQLIIKIEHINNIEQAELLRNKLIQIKNTSLAKINDDNNFYITDLIDNDVIDQNNNIIGKIINVSNHGAGDNIIIEFNNKEIGEYPFIKTIFPKINLKNAQITFLIPQTI